MRALIFWLAVTSLSTPLVANALSILDDRQIEHQFEQAPTRVVSLNWTLTEQLIELGIAPIAATDLSGYQDWVAKPSLPTNIIDLGTRAEPNLGRLARLEPQLILINETHHALLPQLEQIAPVIFFNTFSREHNNAEQAIKVFRQLATLFDRERLAEQKLTAMQQRFEQLRAQLLNAYQGQLPKVTSVRFANPSLVYIYGDNAMSQYALEQLGIEAALPQAKSQWGLVQKRTLELSKIDSGSVLYFEPFAQWPKLKASRLWQAMPFVRAGRIAAVESTWTYGGAISLKYLAESMTKSLLSIAPRVTYE